MHTKTFNRRDGETENISKQKRYDRAKWTTCARADELDTKSNCEKTNVCYMQIPFTFLLKRANSCP